MATNETGQSGGPIFMTGGTGFVGTNIRAQLGERPLRLLVRNPSAHPGLAGPNVEVVAGNVADRDSLRGALDGCSAVINLTAIIREEGDQTFDRVIRLGTENVVEEAKAAGVPRFLHMSALGTHDDPTYAYFYAKWRAEQAVMSSGMAWTIFRPSIIFGPGDGFINQLADLVRSAPVVPVVGDGTSKFQPIHVQDVAAAFVRALDDPSTAGKIYELGGPDILTYEQILDIVGEQLGKRKSKVHLPKGLMSTVVKLASPLPSALQPPVTAEQLKMLAIDNCTADNATEALIGRPPRPLKGNLEYLR